MGLFGNTADAANRASIHWHWLWMNGEAQATWVLCALTAVLCGSILLTWKSMRWTKQQQNLQTMSSRFNANDMLFARAMTAERMSESNLSSLLGHSPAHAHKVLAFLMQLEQMLQRNELNLDDVVIHFGDHIMMYGSKFTRLGDKQLQGKFDSFIALHKKTQKSKRYRQYQNELETYFDKEFWECEASLKGRG